MTDRMSERHRMPERPEWSTRRRHRRTSFLVGQVRSSRVAAGDVLISVGLLLLFSAAFLAASAWPFRANVFPRVVALAGATLVLLQLLSLLLAAVPRTQKTVRSADPDKAGPLPGTVNAADDSLEYVFQRAPLRSWLAAIGWVTLFVAGLVILGIYPTVLLFSLTYLRKAAQASWRLSITYALVAVGVLYVGTAVLLVVPVPDGLF